MPVPHMFRNKPAMPAPPRLCSNCRRETHVTMPGGCPKCFDFEAESMRLLKEEASLFNEKKATNSKRNMKEYRAKKKGKKTDGK